MNNLCLLFSCSLSLMLATAPEFPQQEQRHFLAKANMRLTNAESLWTGRFSDCDFRYYVLIPSSFVTHADRPPRRLHAVLFSLPDTTTTNVVTAEDERLISVTARSNELEFKSLKEFSGQVLDSLGKEKSGFEIKARESSRLDGEPATRFRVEYNGPDGRVVEEELLALRSSIRYEIGLRTTAGHYEIDERNLSKVVAGFRFWKNYRCYGTNNNP